MNHRQWLNIMIVMLAFSTLLFLFAHQKLTELIPDDDTVGHDFDNKNLSESSLETDNSRVAIFDTTAPISHISFSSQKNTDKELLKHWQSLKLKSHQKTLATPKIMHSIKVHLAENGESRYFSIVLDQLNYYLIRHSDQKVFNLPHQDYVKIIPPSYNPS